MSELKKWRVTGPDGFNCETAAPLHYMAGGVLEKTFREREMNPTVVLRQAGYRAEPIEEPKMVTVRAEDVKTLISAEPRSRADVHDAFCRIRAALEAAK